MSEGKQTVDALSDLFPSIHQNPNPSPSGGAAGAEVNPVSSAPTFQREPLDDAAIQAMSPHLFDHWQETTIYPDIPLSPQFDLYRDAEQRGTFRFYTARLDGNLIGYFGLILFRHLHHSTSLQAGADLIYIAKEHRGFGGRFIGWCRQQLKAEGVQVCSISVKAHLDWSPLLVRAGFQLQEQVYSVRLDL